MSEQPKWTPGNWTADITDPSDVVVWASPDPKQNDELIANIGQRVQPVQVAFDCDAANAHLISAAPDLYSGGEAQTAIIRRAQAILTQYLIPDGIEGPEAINQLLGLLDGPDQRAAQSAWDAATAKANPQPKETP